MSDRWDQCRCGRPKVAKAIECLTCYLSEKRRRHENCQKALLLFYAMGLFPKEIASRLNLNRKYVETIITAAKRRFRVYDQVAVIHWAIKHELL